jgi:hypothetical protein
LTTTIAPSLGHNALTQQGAGTTPGYDAIDFRRLATAALQEGVTAGGACMVTQRGAGANMSVDIAASTGDTASGVAAVIQGDSVSFQSLYPVPPHSGVINETISAAHATLPRIDSIILELKDNAHDASGSNLAQTRVLTGTATSGATLDNRTGAVALPVNALLLADVLVGAAVSSITNAVIRDRRKWARGAYYSAIITAGDYTITSSSAAIDSVRMSKRIECSGAPVRVRLNAAVDLSTSQQMALFLFVDGVSVYQFTVTSSATLTTTAPSLDVTYQPAAGSHTFAWFAQMATGTGTVHASAFGAAVFEIEELVRQNTPNNSVTTG